MKRIFYNICSSIIILCLLLGVSGAALAQSVTDPVQIEADRMESTQKQNAVLFTGHVEAKQKDMVIHADKMTVQYRLQEKKKQGLKVESRTISKIFAEGNVEVSKEGWVATGDELEFFAEENKALLTGNTKVWQDNNLVTGDSIILYLDEGKSVVKRSGDKDGGRVKAFFYPGSGGQQK